jgi:hypothetical protein
MAGALWVALVLGALVFALFASAHEGGIEKGLDADAAGNAVLAANPELMVARRYSSAAAQTAADARLVANPELISLRQYDTCGC